MEKNKITSMDIGEFQEDLEAFVNAFERLQKLSSWMTTIALASLGFILTFLFQIRSKATVPNKYLAAGILVFLLISTLLGFYGKFRFELSQFAKDLKRGARGLSDMLYKASKEFSLPDEITKLFLVIGERVKELINEFPGSSSKYKLLWPVVGQGVTLTLGIVLFGRLHWHIPFHNIVTVRAITANAPDRKKLAGSTLKAVLA